MKPKKLHVSVRILPDGHKHPFKVADTASLLEVMQEGAQECDVVLLPMAEEPLDSLHNIGKHGEVGPAIDDLGQSANEYISEPDRTGDFGIALALVIRVNTQWDTAPQASMSPREILQLFGLEYQEYTLYRPLSADVLPLDEPIDLARGDAFEAQRDGKYGDSQ